MLNQSQFRRVLQMGLHTFSFELWWIFAGKPIRYAIQDFAMVTGLNC
ncbi:unnamed protein product, partial [Brassica rapa subsp. narinosa]